MTGKLIVFEGLDGSGITTQATLLRNYFLGKDKDAILTKEPTDGLIGGIIKACLRKEWKTDSLTLQMLFAADRAHHLSTEIEPAIKKKAIEQERLFRVNSFDSRLHTHKLHGPLSEFWAFSVDHTNRVIFVFVEANIVVFYSVGDHDIYN